MLENDNTIRSVVQSKLIKELLLTTEITYPTLKAREDSVKETIENFINYILDGDNEFSEEEIRLIIKEELDKRGLGSYYEYDIELDDEER